jgi:hypothetical protein
VKSSYQSAPQDLRSGILLPGLRKLDKQNIVIHTKRSLLDLDSRSHAATSVGISIGEENAVS